MLRSEKAVDLNSAQVPRYGWPQGLTWTMEGQVALSSGVEVQGYLINDAGARHCCRRISLHTFVHNRKAADRRNGGRRYQTLTTEREQRIGNWK